MAKTNKVEKKAGRPSKYLEGYDEQAYKLCLLGATDKEMADFFNVVESTINLWKIEHPSFSESITRGKEFADMGVAYSLLDGTKDRVVIEQQGFKVRDVFYNDEGKKIKETERVEVIDVQRVIPGDFRNQQFWLKNRKASKWRDKTEIDHTTQGDRINLSNVPTETLKQLLNGISKPGTDG